MERMKITKRNGGDKQHGRNSMSEGGVQETWDRI
jgi:hypothetical protein